MLLIYFQVHTDSLDKALVRHLADLGRLGLAIY